MNNNKEKSLGGIWFSLPKSASSTDYQTLADIEQALLSMNATLSIKMDGQDDLIAFTNKYKQEKKQPSFRVFKKRVQSSGGTYGQQAANTPIAPVRVPPKNRFLPS